MASRFRAAAQREQRVFSNRELGPTVPATVAALHDAGATTGRADGAHIHSCCQQGLDPPYLPSVQFELLPIAPTLILLSEAPRELHT